MTKPSRITWALIVMAPLATLLLGAGAAYTWIQHYRFASLNEPRPVAEPSGGPYAGSESCRECHERFYQLWSPSHHGKAMQPITDAFVAAELVALDEPIMVGASRFGVDLAKRAMIEYTPEGERELPMVHALGGKNVFFLLTPWEGGRLQVLPLAFDVRKEEWYHATSSMVRHFEDVDDEEIHWTDSLLTFNTSCYNCHVSQLAKNYDPDTDTYHTVWREPGINCETCHGPATEHAQVCRSVPSGTAPKDIRLISWRDLSMEQRNDACLPCHAKAAAITPSFAPGERFFDHYDLQGLDNPDFYPDGRDLGENYTQTGWQMNPCVQAGALECLHCHTSSGRFRFKDENENRACLPCHARRVRNISAHSHHPPPPKGPKCINCHMPMTAFSRMERSDHTMRPPTPEASLAFNSPNACEICHKKDKTAYWAQKVREWFPDSTWQDRVLHEGTLVDDARKGKWDRLPEMLSYVQQHNSDPVVIASLIRLMDATDDARKWDPIRACQDHAAPFVRARVMDALQANLQDPASIEALTKGLKDDYRLVRTRAVSGLARYPETRLSGDTLTAFKAAEKELLVSFESQPDVWSSHYNMGNYLADRGNPEDAIEAYERSMALRDDTVMPYVNASVLASQQGRLQEGIDYLKRAHAASPENGSVNFNLGLALAESKDLAGAERHLRMAVSNEGTRAQAAYNLAVMVAEKDAAEAIALCRTAVKSMPQNPRYVYTLAYYLTQNRQTDAAIAELEAALDLHPDSTEVWSYLGECYMQEKQLVKARSHFTTMAGNLDLPLQARTLARQRLEQIPQ